MMQKVTSDGENTAVIWVENSENDPFMADGSNSVKIASIFFRVSSVEVRGNSYYTAEEVETSAAASGSHQ